MQSEPPIRTISFRISEDKVAALDLIAKAMDRDRTYLLNEAIESYLDQQSRFAAFVNEGREDLRNGNFLSHEVVASKVEEWERAPH
jgi:predicted transcriptional regulator